MLERIITGFFIAIGFYIAPMVISLILAVFALIYAILNEILKLIIQTIRGTNERHD